MRINFLSPVWTDQRVGELKTLLADPRGLSSREIADAMGTTRNAVIGKVQRLGLKLPNTLSEARSRQAQVSRTRRKEARMQTVIPFVPRVPQFKAEPIQDIGDVIPIGQRVTFEQLRSCHCRWIVGDPKTTDSYYCGGQVKANTSWCPYHYRMVYWRRDQMLQVAAE